MNVPGPTLHCIIGIVIARIMKHGMRGKWERTTRKKEREQVKINGKREVGEREGSASVSQRAQWPQ